MYFSGNPPRKKTNGLLRKIQGTYFKIQAIYFKIYGLYFCIFQTSETQQLTKVPQQPVYFPFFAGTDTPFSALVFSKTELRTALHFARNRHYYSSIIPSSRIFASKATTSSRA